MAVPAFLRRLKHNVRASSKPMAVYFEMSDFDEFQSAAEALAPYGVTWWVEANHAIGPEVAIVYRHGTPVFHVWRSSTGLMLRGLEPRNGFGTLGISTPIQLWSLIVCLTKIPVSLEDDKISPVSHHAFICPQNGLDRSEVNALFPAISHASSLADQLHLTPPKRTASSTVTRIRLRSQR